MCARVHIERRGMKKALELSKRREERGENHHCALARTTRRDDTDDYATSRATLRRRDPEKFKKSRLCRTTAGAV